MLYILYNFIIYYKINIIWYVLILSYINISMHFFLQYLEFKYYYLEYFLQYLEFKYYYYIFIILDNKNCNIIVNLFCKKLD